MLESIKRLLPLRFAAGSVPRKFFCQQIDHSGKRLNGRRPIEGGDPSPACKDIKRRLSELDPRGPYHFRLYLRVPRREPGIKAFIRKLC